MAHLHKKIKKGNAYYYVRETQRIDGKPTVVNQVYLGSADKILSVFMAKESGFPSRISSKEFGSLFALLEIDKPLDFAGIVDGVVPAKRKRQGPSTGELMLYAVINRAIAPMSKRRMSEWYGATDIQQIRPVNLDALTAQNFWNHWDRIGEHELTRIMDRFFTKVRTLSHGEEEHFLFDTTNYYTYLSSRTPSTLAKRGHNKAGKHYLRQVGLALITERSSYMPVYASLYPGNQHDSRFFRLHLDEIVARLRAAGTASGDITLIFDKGMNAEEAVQRIDGDEKLHFITSYSPYFAPELAAVPLSQFRLLPCEVNDRLLAAGQAKDQILYHETTASFWGRERKVVMTFNPRTFRKKRYDLKEKLNRLREDLFTLRRAYREGHPHSRSPEAIRERYEKMCASLHLSPALFNLSFFTEDSLPAMGFELNRYQVDATIKRMAKSILVTDHHTWTAQEVYSAYRDRHLIENQFRKTKHPFQIAFMPQYHWTDSKIRIHAFVCIAALVYLTLLEHSLRAHGLKMSAAEAVRHLRDLRTALFWLPGAKKPGRRLEEPTSQQIAVLDALGFVIQDGRVLQKQ